MLAFVYYAYGCGRLSYLFIPTCSSNPLASTNILYRRAIIKAIEELQDCQLRSNIDAISRHVQASFGPEHVWNDKVFLMTLKSLANEGHIEQCTGVNCGFSPEFKRKRTGSIAAVLETKSKYSINGANPQTQTLVQPSCYMARQQPYLQPFQLPIHGGNKQEEHQSTYEDAKESPKRKIEHAKMKIVPKKIYDKQQ